MRIAYLLLVDLWFIHELRYDMVALGFSSAVWKGRRGKWITIAVRVGMT